ncbi:3-hydroxyisobutyrate dehydrogenase [Streptomyces lavendulae subsp. lavendulae]|uniref:3-hydroxyisobutyrate dehydrogenase n=1 Tax=Streptomyces lavendulae subsp. lavendulae TaxID=58340 RepID=A0A2K8PPQ5_STRLA|nr:NAD(P)-binding domain-containing protein [Streptomyces lavendulae]ATZ28711.1 3-hydroxyisobutyrate dehydrogenase [Streptomyces lavendulae subsp. lavendulae]QUQ58536.1 3-sulfolactaldehyde reductase [Streptomyces lavendulae subsp. lavendulae]
MEHDTAAVPPSPLVPGDTVAVLGAGPMLSLMLPRIRRSGFLVRLHHAAPGRPEGPPEPGTTLCATPREAAEGARAVLAVVNGDAASRSVWLAADGALAGTRPGIPAVECSPLSDGWTADWAGACRERALAPVDAPVTASTPRAADGTPIVFAGGSAAAVEAARPLLAGFTEQVFRLGPTGSGGRFRQVDDLLAGSVLVALGEAFATAERLGLDLARALDVLSESGRTGGPAPAGDRAVRAHRADISRLLARMAKDLGYTGAVRSGNLRILGGDKNGRASRKHPGGGPVNRPGATVLPLPARRLSGRNPDGR